MAWLSSTGAVVHYRQGSHRTEVEWAVYFFISLFFLPYLIGQLKSRQEMSGQERWGVGMTLSDLRPDSNLGPPLRHVRVGSVWTQTVLQHGAVGLSYHHAGTAREKAKSQLFTHVSVWRLQLEALRLT